MPERDDADGDVDDGRAGWLGPSASLAWQLRTALESADEAAPLPGFGALPDRAREGDDREPVDPATILAGVRELEVHAWCHGSADETVRHVGPRAAALAEAFDLGGDAGRVAWFDADGVAFAAIQGLARRLDEQRERIATQRETIETQRGHIAAQRERLAECAARLDALEAELSAAGADGDSGTR